MKDESFDHVIHDILCEKKREVKNEIVNKRNNVCFEKNIKKLNVYTDIKKKN